MSDNTTENDALLAAEPTADEAVVDAPAPGLELVKTEINGDLGREHHWFTIPFGHKIEDYQAELEAFAASRLITLDDLTVTTA